MNDQAKRWTAEGYLVIRGEDSAECYSENPRVMAQRLAACADLLRGVGDLSAVAVMKKADVEMIREAMYWFGRGAGEVSEQLIKRILETLPVPPKGDCK